MTEIQQFINRVREYTEKATKGPWTYDIETLTVCNDVPLPISRHRHKCISDGKIELKQDAEFIAFSRTDLPQALDIIEQQAKEIEELKAKLKQDNDGWLKIVRDKDDEMEVMKHDLIVLASKMGLDLA